jgi:chitin disaccharide deacetylase
VRRHLIVNADDFGASTGINRGIVEAHQRGIVTSTSLMVNRDAAREAAQLGRANPGISIGLHFEQPDFLDMSGTADVAAELDRQLDRFRELMGGNPTHLDSHHHVHRAPECAQVFQTAAGELGIPLRELSPVAYIGGFYAQWEWQVTNLEYVSVEFLEQILRTEVSAEWTELGCHPGYVSDDFSSVYLSEREAEVATLTDARVAETLAELGIDLASYADYAVSGSPSA